MGPGKLFLSMLCINVSYAEWEEDEVEDLVDPFQKIGAKKLRRIKEKAAKKAQREVCMCMCGHA